jgi:hypothetical protein
MLAGAPVGGDSMEGGRRRRGKSVKTLKRALKKAGLKTTGKKATLRARAKKAHLKLGGNVDSVMGVDEKQPGGRRRSRRSRKFLGVF